MGTYFIGYASTFTTTRQMLESMFIGNPVGNTDRLLDFSTAVTGTLFLCSFLRCGEGRGEKKKIKRKGGKKVYTLSSYSM